MLVSIRGHNSRVDLGVAGLGSCQCLVVLLSKIIVLLLKLIVLLFRRFLHDILDDILFILCFTLDLRLLDHLLGLADDLRLLVHREGTYLL